MINNLQHFIANQFKVNFNVICGKQQIKNNYEYTAYNISMLISYLLIPTKRYGIKSTIHRLHRCKSTNRIQRLMDKYSKDTSFRLKVNIYKQLYTEWIKKK
jgi:hypothetical protein